MSVRAKLERLEKAAGVGVMCLSCKYSLILYADTLKRTPREDRHVRDCPDCGFPSFTILAGYSERERALIIETFYYLEDDRPRTLAERQRNYAAQVYYFVHPRTREIRAIAAREEKRLRDLNPVPLAARTQLKVLDEWKAQQAEREASRRLLLSEEEDEARAERKGKSAPTMAVIERERGRAQEGGKFRPDEELYFLRVMAGLEPLIFGETLPETLAKIEAHEQGVREAAERKEREDREQAEQRERREREERYRLEAAERERERDARERARLSGGAARANVSEQSALVSRFRTDPTAPVPRNPMVFDPTAAHVPEPACMVVPDPADPSKQMMVTGNVGPATYDPNHPDAVQFMRSTPEKLPDHQKYYRGEYYDGD